MDVLEGVRLKLDRAEHVIEELYEAVVTYLAEHNYEVIGEFERERSEYVLRGRVTKRPVELGVIAGDAVHNLRSALDHLAWQLALLTTATPFEYTAFPIALTPGEFCSRRGQSMIQDISAKHRALIETFQPYNGTKKKWTPLALRDLRFLSNTDKHRVLNAAIAKKSVKLKAILGLEMIQDVTACEDIIWFSEGPIDGAELARMKLVGIGPDPKVKMKGLLPVTIGFDDPALTGTNPHVIPLLKAILHGVQEVVVAFEPDLQPR